MTSWHHEALVAARADAILTSAPTTKAYAQHFEAQLRAARFRALGRRSLLVLLRVLRRPVIVLAIILCPWVLLDSAAHSPAAAPHIGQSPS